MPERSTKAITGQREEKMLLQRTRAKLEKIAHAFYLDCLSLHYYLKYSLK